ncbi:uncharacterized protein BKA78DRAFT_97622 [Phyllosticta capitalensis]|uniref:uncharacterized protein n=1 Tax=Phyllosticta capitalensis TaxID=121624 RepID=UPI00312EBD91
MGSSPLSLPLTLLSLSLRLLRLTKLHHNFSARSAPTRAAPSPPPHRRHMPCDHHARHPTAVDAASDGGCRGVCSGVSPT